jgi:hypothetical protein
MFHPKSKFYLQDKYKMPQLPVLLTLLDNPDTSEHPADSQYLLRNADKTNHSKTIQPCRCNK